MEQQAFVAELREQTGSAHVRQLRRAGKVPAVLYGHGKEVVSLALTEDDVHGIITGGHHLVSLDIGGKAESAIIKEVQWDTWSRHVLHLDFGRVSLDETVSVSVSINTHGTPKAVVAGASLDQSLYEIEVQCAANNIPDEITIEVGEMETGDAVYVKDLPLPEGVVTEVDADAIVIVLNEARELEEVAPAEAEEGAVDGTEPEVISKGKDEEDAEASSES